MPTPKPNKTHRVRRKVEARCGKHLKLRILHAKRSTGYQEADFLLTALEEFFAAHQTAAEQMAAVQRSRAASAAMDAVPAREG